MFCFMGLDDVVLAEGQGLFLPFLLLSGTPVPTVALRCASFLLHIRLSRVLSWQGYSL